MPPNLPLFNHGQAVVRIYKAPYVDGDDYEIGEICGNYRDKNNGGYYYCIAAEGSLSIPEEELVHYDTFFGI